MILKGVGGESGSKTRKRTLWSVYFTWCTITCIDYHATCNAKTATPLLSRLKLVVVLKATIASNGWLSDDDVRHSSKA